MGGARPAPWGLDHLDHFGVRRQHGKRCHHRRTRRPRSAYPTAATAPDVDLVTDAALDITATGGGVYLSLIGQSVATTTNYGAKLRYPSNGSTARNATHRMLISAHTEHATRR